MQAEKPTEAREFHLKEKADFIRKELFRVAVKNGKKHIAPSLSCVDILVVLFYDVLRPEDHFILSKSHGAYGYYAILADLGKIPKDVWENFQLPGCCERKPEYSILAGCGSLGHGLPMAVGLAYGMKLKSQPGLVYVLVGDGEMDEGSNWEALTFASRQWVTNLRIIVDCNQFSALRYATDSDTLKDRFEAFGRKPVIGFPNWNGYYYEPDTFLVETVKGNGMKCAEGKAKFHFRSPSCAELWK